jgi:hypothetical protein
MNRKGMWLAVAVMCALVAPIRTLTATSNVPVGSTVTALDLCQSGPGGLTYPGSTAPAGCEGDSTGATTVTFCRDANVHAFVGSQIMVDGRRPALVPVEGVVAVRLESPTYGNTHNVATNSAGTGLQELGVLPVGTYDVTASLWTGTRTTAEGALESYPSSKTMLSLVVSESPCGGAVPTAPGKKGCGGGDANHVHNPKSGKTCPTK